MLLISLQKTLTPEEDDKVEVRESHCCKETQIISIYLRSEIQR